MQIVVRIFQFILPYMIKFVDKHSDEWLTMLYNNIGGFLNGKIADSLDDYELNNSTDNKSVSSDSSTLDEVKQESKEGKEVKNMAKISIHVKDLAGHSLNGVFASFNTNHGKIDRTTDENGNVSISGLDQQTVTISFSKDGYISQEIPIDVAIADIYKDIILMPVKTSEQATVDAINNTMSASSGVISSVVDTLSGKITSFDDAKVQYKALEQLIKADKKDIEKALKDGAIDIVQSKGAELIAIAKVKLTESMQWYVAERSKINPFGSWVEFREWAELSSMIAGIYLARANLVTFVNKMIEQLGRI